MLLRDKEREELHSYITGILKNKSSPLIEINSVGDHIHILYTQSKNEALAKVVEQVKSSSSGWIKEQHRAYFDFAWQAGYGAFSVSQSNRAAVIRYVEDQVRHHARVSYREEFVALLMKHGVEFEEEYLWR